MLQYKKKWSILLHVILLVNIVLIVWVVVFNNSFVVINNIDIWNNQEEAFSNIYNKWHIAIDSVVKYNTNGGWFLDGISCPSNVTMSGSNNRTSWIATTLVYKYGTIHCAGTYQSKEFKIYYDELVNDFKSVKFEDEVINIEPSVNTIINIWSSNLALNEDVTSSEEYYNYYNYKAVDGNVNSFFDTQNRSSNEFIKIDLWSEKNIWKIVLRKPSSYGYWDWDKVTVRLSDNSDNLISDFANISFPIGWSHEINLLNYGLSNSIRYVSLHVAYYYLFISEIEIYELISSWSEEIWEAQSNFTDDNTYFSFTSDGISWNNWIDDDLNSDNYSVTSIWNIYFPNDYQDDDVVPRLTVFGSIPVNDKYHHIYWNNYKTVEYLSGNINNNDALNVKMWDIDTAYMFLDTFNSVEQDFDLKILEFDRDIYKNEFTLLPINTNEGKNLTDYIWYIQKSSTWSLSLSKETTWDEFEFDFKNKDYALFLKNNTTGTVSYHLSAETVTWTWIYINPIDDSWTGTVKILSNHIIIGGEKNFIWENFEVVWSK
jgi:hypothetical protein